MAGVDHGSKDLVFWEGELPQLSGIPGMRIVLNDLENDTAEPFQFKQMVLEIDKATGHIEQVVYVIPVDKSRAKLLIENWSSPEEKRSRSWPGRRSRFSTGAADSRFARTFSEVTMTFVVF